MHQTQLTLPVRQLLQACRTIHALHARSPQSHFYSRAAGSRSIASTTDDMHFIIFKQFKCKCLAVVSSHQSDSAIPEGEKDGSFLFGTLMILKKHWSAVFTIG